MKPNFALKLSHDGLDILQRAASGWIVKGSARFDAPDLDRTLGQLRQQAEALAPEGLHTKLIMPDSEVRYATVIAPGPTDEARRLQIEAEIEGLTPYALHELAYDYVVEGDHALVAICAREILAEAESFAQTHGFNPVSFVAIPRAGAFAGEPFFGETAGARAFLSRNTSVERDSEPVRIAGDRRAAPEAPPPPRPAAATAPTRPAPTAGRPIPTAPEAARAAATSDPEAAPDAFSRVGSLVRRMGTRIRREQAQGVPESPASPPAAAPSAPPPTASPTKPGNLTKPASGESATEAPATPRPEAAASRPPVAEAKATAKPDGRSADTGKAGKTNKEETPSPAAGKPSAPQTAKVAPVAFSSRRSAPSTTQPAAPPPGPPPGTTPAAAESASDAKRPALVSDGPGSGRAKPNPGGRIAVLPAGGEKEGPGRLTRLYRRSRRAAKGALASVGLAKAKQGGGKRGGGGKRRQQALQQPLVPASAPPVDERAKASEAAAMTIFGARNMQRTETGFARRGLMLTGGLLLLLVAVAIWALYFTSGPVREADIAQTGQDSSATLPPVDAPAQAPGDAATGITAPAPVTAPADDPAPEPEPETSAQASPVTDEAEAEDTATATTTDPDALLEELVQEALTEALPVDLLGQTDEAAAPPGDPATSGATDDAALEAMESPQVIPEGESDADQRLALPPVLERPQLAEVAPVSPPPPPPFGTEFTLGPDGLVEATPEGAMTPSGVMVFAGPPSEVPPARPAGIVPEAPPAAEPAAAPETDATDEAAPEPEAQLQPPAAEAAAENGPAQAETTETTETAATPDDAPLADPALAGFRPLPRSPLVAGLAAQAAADAPGTDPAPEPAATEGVDPDDDSAAAAPTPGGVLLDGLRPQRRPTDLVPPAELADAADATPEEDEAPEVVAVSLRPTARPNDISARVQESLAAARAPAAAAAAPAAAAPAPAPAASAAPNIPTSASVAQQATQARAINLRRVNLIGVFGTPNDRRALVRLSNGQVVRVQVGDRLDGGQVSAIGDDELRYVKNGRNEVLRIGSSG